MAKISFSELQNKLYTILLSKGLSEKDSQLCATVFANSTADGYHSHGVNRFKELIKTIDDGYVKVDVKPELVGSFGAMERWDGHLGVGILNAHHCMDRAIALAKENVMGCVALRNGSHWKRGGTYGWQAADAGCIGICFTNTMPNMPTWGSKEPNTGNNPMIMAVPHENGHIVLDISMSQFSYGKMWKTAAEGKDLPFPGGFDEAGNLSKDPGAIAKAMRPLPTGYWKGSGLSIMLDLIVTLLSDGRSTAKIGEMEIEYGLSQVFICFDAEQINSSNQHAKLINEIVEFVTSATPDKEGSSIEYPGSQTLKRRAKSMAEGIEVSDKVWADIQSIL